MQTYTFSAIKGGVGKSSLAILTANILAAAEYKVLCIDADPQNSMSFYYLPDRLDLKESLADLFINQIIKQNVIHTTNNLDLIPSSLELIYCRNIDTDILKLQLASIQQDYDYVIIDTAPTFDSITTNCLNAADKIITPVQFSNFDFKSALFYKDILTTLDCEHKWYLLMNKFKSIKNGNSIAGQFFQIYSSTFANIFTNKIPDSSIIRQYFDTASYINQSKVKKNIFQSLKLFTEELTEKTLSLEVF